MQVCTTLIDASGHIFERRTTHDAQSVIGAAKPSHKVIATKGKAWADQSMKTLGRGLAKAMLAGKKQGFDQAILDLLVAVWLIDSIFGELDADEFQHSNHAFTVDSHGNLIYDRRLMEMA